MSEAKVYNIAATVPRRIVIKRWTPTLPISTEEVMRRSGDLSIWVDDFEFLTIHYRYDMTDNASQYALATEIVRSYFGCEPIIE